jgi:small subunit ribosomal protein S3
VGQKIHPVGMRLGITRTWDSRWFEKKHYVEWLHEDVAIRKSFNRWMRSASISKIEIERRANQARVIVNTAKPGIIIGKRGVGIDEIRKTLEQLTGKSISVNVMEISHPELDARLVAQNIVDQLEKRIAFRRAMKQSIMRTMRAGARGIKVQVSGRLGGAEIARTEHNADGKVPLHTLRADIDYAQVEAFTTFGRIGVKVWIYRGEVLPDQPRGDGALRDRPDRGRDRRERGGRGRRDGRPDGRPAGPAPAAMPAPETSMPAPETSMPAPEPSMPAPEPSMPAPETSMLAPEPSMSAPEPSLPAPEPSLPAPEPSMSAPEPSLPAPEPSMSAPEAQPAAPSEVTE